MSDPVGEQLAAWGKVALLETRGRVSGRSIVTPVGFAEREGGVLVAAAGAADADWALNLLADPRCRVTIGERTFAATAEELGGTDRSAAVRDLILKYGTPAERLGSGPVFALREVALR